MSMPAFEPRGVIPACLMPFDEDHAVDEQAYRRHLNDIASVDGVAAIAINGHAAEVHALTLDEQHRAIAVTLEELEKYSVPAVVGIYTNSSLEAARMAERAQQEGAHGLLVFPPDFMSLGGHLRPEMAIEHLRHLTGASDLPIILFQYPLISGLSYPLSTLIDLCIRFPSIRAVKDQIGDGNLHERQIRELRNLDRPVRTLTTHSAWLLGSLALGCDGLLSGAGSVIPDLQVALFRAVQAGDLKKAQAINDRIYPMVRAFYDPPLLDMHNRMKETLVLLGRLDRAVVRPPLMKPRNEEIAKIRKLLVDAGITANSVYGYAA
ncbi:MAG: dihydrodipicolinate synthase family protein [Mesorhizobium sp.]|uniref:dihydrodipicolinate synthase family protein n=1 Tax=Mesorhizobium sp. TaxID=1871066 RepID=UPI001215B5E5|nr:dihydrodipicolinate synthase family protein [Mesorhizobium sp.]TIN95506.1 MAG: dihydrodipicolinate synthase family protein [Mesorhizobium sp.]TJU97152.1 MAG: dihydrodipicolinate synthase family protein [Mesorhizobium sp.]